MPSTVRELRRVVERVGGTVGSLAGTFPTGGQSLWATVGSTLGGLVGRKDDKNTQANPVVNGIDAIERPHRERTNAIQTQTDALFNPENRPLNLLSSFNVPPYAPSFTPGGSSSVARVSYGNTYVRVKLNVTSNQSAHDIKRLAREGVEDAMGQAMYSDGISVG